MVLRPEADSEAALSRRSSASVFKVYVAVPVVRSFSSCSSLLPAISASGQDLQPHFDASTYDASFRESQYSATLLIDPRLSRPASSLADRVESYGDQSSNAHRRSTDGGVTIAGGPGLDVGDAPSVSEIQSIKSRLPPVYQAYSTV